MNKEIIKLSNLKGKRLLKLKILNSQLVKKKKNFLCILKYEGNYEIYYLLKYIRKKKSCLSKNFLMENLVDKSKLKINFFAPNLLIFSII